MRVFVSGGSASGKSEYAENRALELAQGTAPLVYIATMQPFGREAEARVARHRALRSGKGFATLEQYRGLKTLSPPAGSVVLLECMGNLLANEMFSEEGISPAAEEEVLAGLKALGETAASLIVVSNDVCFDGAQYSPETMEYCRTLARLNRRLAAACDEVVEVCCALPILHKRSC